MNGEVIVVLVVNIESMELCRLECQIRCLLLEYFRVFFIDDLEGYFLVFYYFLGVIFDYKIFIENSLKIIQEFVKKVDYDLFFFYWIGINERFYEGLMVLFNVFLVEGIERLDWVIIFCRVDLGVFFVNRVLVL